MAINHYFQGGRGIGNNAEQRLHEDLIIEGLKIYGQDVYYLPRTLVNRDLVLGEDTTSRFDDSYMIEMYFETQEGFAGEQELINKFGLEIREDTTLVVSKRRFEEHVASKANLIAVGRPNEGDIIYLPLMNSFFEIQFVEDQEPFFQLGNLPVYKLRVTRFEYANEEINTGQEILDQAEDKYSLNELNHKVGLESGQVALTGDGSIELEDYFDYSTGQKALLMLETFTGAKSIQTQSNYANNLDMNASAGYDTVSTADDILDFTERNPFGEVDE
nr:neck protein [uncultured Mediterranean phage uvMED]|tara:strand:+ start:351 stop:1172 length:822 start_codon:yes stop_codon:yes gene_type:complete